MTRLVGVANTPTWTSEPAWPEAIRGTWPEIAISGQDATTAWL
ncbi:hypothetical protein ACFYWX_25955 [Streptomyces sp. NPDC002888]